MGQDHEIVSVSDKPFSSIPLFLPSDVDYDPKTNTVSPSTLSKDEAGEGPHLVLVPNAGYDMLLKMKPRNAPISAIACVGPYRTGKSLLVSRFLQDSKAFQIGPTLEGCTRGIWISTSVLKQKSTGVLKFVLDCEGMGDPLSASGADASVSNDARIALACVLLSTVFLFNNTSHPDRGSLNFLRYLDTIRKRIPVSKNRVKYPSFLWVFRDFFLQLPPKPDNPQEKYTLEEYMMERVLKQKHTADDAQIVDSLLKDFASFNVLSIGYPKREQGMPFGLEEMASLDKVPWPEFDESFRTEMEGVIQHCLDQADMPFLLGDGRQKSKMWPFSPKASSSRGSFATGKVYAKWCETVTELVNSEGVIPNIPELQDQLLKALADEQLKLCIETYEKELSEVLESCPVYNEEGPKGFTSNGDKKINDLLAPAIGIGLETLINEYNLKSVADAEKLMAASIYTSERLIEELRESISSERLIEDTIGQFHAKCSDESNKGSFLAQMLSENYKRSEKACEVLAKGIYLPIREKIRDDPTKVSVLSFETVGLVEIEKLFTSCARGPAIEETLEQFIKVPGDADVIFLGRVQEKQGLLESALEKQQNLEKDLNETIKKNRLELEKLNVEHTKAMEKAIAEQKKREEAQLAAWEEKMQKQLKDAETSLAQKEQERLAEINRLKAESESKLLSEISAREERIKNEQIAYQAELAHIKAIADTKLEDEMNAAEKRRVIEQEQLKEEMEAKLKEAEERMQAEIKRKEEALTMAAEEMSKKAKENFELMERAEKAESQACPVLCCCM